jgi:hypothetical protein
VVRHGTLEIDDPDDRRRHSPARGVLPFIVKLRSVVGSRWWPAGLVWTLALLGLFLLPIDFRAGAEQAHAHALLHLWADASDGAIHHHGSVGDWLDPAVGSTASDAAVSSAATADVGDHEDSAPAAGGVSFLLGAMTALPALSPRSTEIFCSSRRLVGYVPRMASPPPKWTAGTI